MLSGGSRSDRDRAVALPDRGVLGGVITVFWRMTYLISGYLSTKMSVVCPHQPTAGGQVGDGLRGAVWGVQREGAEAEGGQGISFGKK